MPDEKYQYGIDFERIAAIDIHTHVEVDGHGHKAYDDELVEAVGKYFKMGPKRCRAWTRWPTSTGGTTRQLWSSPSTRTRE